MTEYPRLLHAAIDTTDVRGLPEFYRQLLGLHYRPGDEPPADRGADQVADDAGWLVPSLQELHRNRALAESLGGVESLISHPASLTHASVDPARRTQLGITEGLVRLSCGVEDVGDLLADLEHAFHVV